MTQRVKEFIEEYIAEIELGRWEEVFDGWYDETTDTLSWEDDDEINELFQVLRVLNVTEKTTEADRKSVIEKYAESIVNDRQHKYYNRIDRWDIKWDSILVDLNSTLGFTYDELCDILNDLDMSGVTPDKSNKRFVIEGL